MVPVDVAPNDPPRAMRWLRGKPMQFFRIFAVTKRLSTGNHEAVIFSTASLDDVRSAIDSAYEAFDRWPLTPLHERGRILFKAAEIIEQSLDEFSRLLTREEGKNLREQG